MVLSLPNVVLSGKEDSLPSAKLTGTQVELNVSEKELRSRLILFAYWERISFFGVFPPTTSLITPAIASISACISFPPSIIVFDSFLVYVKAKIS